MLYRSKFNGVPIYPTMTIDGTGYDHMMGMGDVMVWTGRVGTYDAVSEPEMYYEVYAPIQGTSGWVWTGNIEPLEG